MAVEPLADFVSVPEAAAILQVSPSTIWRWIDHGDLPAARVGRRAVRIRRQDLVSVLTPARRPGSEAVEMVAQRRAQARAAVRRFRALIQEQSVVRQGHPYPASWEMLNEARDERTRDLALG